MFVCTSSAHSRVAERALHLWLGPARFFAFFFALFVFVFDGLLLQKNLFHFPCCCFIVIVVVAFAVFAIVDFCHFLCLPLAWSCRVTI